MTQVLGFSGRTPREKPSSPRGAATMTAHPFYLRALYNLRNRQDPSRTCLQVAAPVEEREREARTRLLPPLSALNLDYVFVHRTREDCVTCGRDLLWRPCLSKFSERQYCSTSSAFVSFLLPSRLICCQLVMPESKSTKRNKKQTTPGNQLTITGQASDEDRRGDQSVSALVTCESNSRDGAESNGVMGSSESDMTDDSKAEDEGNMLVQGQDVSALCSLRQRGTKRTLRVSVEKECARLAKAGRRHSKQARTASRGTEKGCSDVETGRSEGVADSHAVQAHGVAAECSAAGNRHVWPTPNFTSSMSSGTHSLVSPCRWRTVMESQHFCYELQRRSVGLKSSAEALCGPLWRQINHFKLDYLTTPFARRATAMTWHPLRATLLVVGSKGGEYALFDFGKEKQANVIVPGIGPGGVVQAMKFWPRNLDLLLTACMDSGVVLRDLRRGSSSILCEMDDPYKKWFCSVDVASYSNSNLIAAGDSSGDVVLLTGEGKVTFSSRLHKSKVTHVEFCPKDSYLLCTASVDRTVKLWDYRYIKDRSSMLHEFQHDMGVNSACFSRTDGCRLLTTDQYDQVRVYAGPAWYLEHTVRHPHRFFQHLTPIKASWHPLADIVVIGRYPDDKNKESTEKRRIDVFEANGARCTYIQDSAAGGISSLNIFNPTGDLLASGMGCNVVLWKNAEEPVIDSASPPDSGDEQGPGGSSKKEALRKPKKPTASRRDAAISKNKLQQKK